MRVTCQWWYYSNSQAVIPLLDSCAARSNNMFASNAYVHQYTNHGLSEHDFFSSFASVEQVRVSVQAPGSGRWPN